ncbi:ML domain-containing protein [Streptomyces roseolilacinus]|uniref:ML domain-containing protein n=1 Tax=Streptomyces roseolilacinus TaxID=66904 RepID=UPI003824C7E1
MLRWDWKDEGLPTDPLRIESITITPDPPKLGADLKVVVEARVQTEIFDGATPDVTVKVGGRKVFQMQFALFEELWREGTAWSLSADSGNGAPVTPGRVVLTFDGRFPSELPQDKFQISVRAYTAEVYDLAAIDLIGSFMPMS